MDDMFEFDAHIRSNKIKLLNNVEDSQLRQKMIFEVLAKKFDGKELDNEMKTLKGIVFLCWKALRDDSITLKDVGGLIDEENLEEVVNIVAGLNGTSEKK